MVSKQKNQKSSQKHNHQKEYISAKQKKEKQTIKRIETPKELRSHNQRDERRSEPSSDEWARGVEKRSYRYRDEEPRNKLIQEVRKPYHE